MNGIFSPNPKYYFTFDLDIKSDINEMSVLLQDFYGITQTGSH